MTLWQYSAVPLERGEDERKQTRGLIAADSVADARARLRGIGLQAITLRSRRGGRVGRKGERVAQEKRGARDARLRVWVGVEHDIRRRANEVLRAQRVGMRAELADSLATLLETGISLREALGTLAASRRRGSCATMLASVRESLGAGESLSACARGAPDWFDGVDCALIEAGESAGTLSLSLRCIGARLERRASSRAKLVGILAYPALVTLVGVGVVAFISSHTLPELTRSLQVGGVEIPRLTLAVMGVGQAITAYWWIAFLLPLVLLAVSVVASRQRARSALWGLTNGWMKGGMKGGMERVGAWLTPRVMRTRSLGVASRTISDLIVAGIPLVDALRITAPTVHASLGGVLRGASDALEGGASIGDAFAASIWFDAETRRLLELAQTTGTLESTLVQVSERLERRATRATEGVMRMLEPTLILILATLIGVVVMAAILPLVRLQEVLR